MIKKLNRTLKKSEDNLSFTENGALGYKSHYEELTTLNFMIPTLRRIDTEGANKIMFPAYFEDPSVFCRWLFFLRDCRGGIGEKNAFKKMFIALSNKKEKLAKRFVEFIPEFGSWKDVVDIYFDYTLKSQVVRDELRHLICDRFSTDLEIVSGQSDKKFQGQDISLLAKWLPSVNAGNKSRNEALQLCKEVLLISPADYRKSVAQMRRYLEVLEQKLCAREFDAVEYDKIPSIAGLRYKNTFIRHDEKRYKEFISSVAKGEKKINVSQVQPQDIYSKYKYNFYVDDAFEEMWKALPKKVKDSDSTLVICDGSGSMLSSISGSICALDVSNSLAIYFSEQLKGEFKDKFITFSSQPQLIDLSECKTLYDKISVMESHYDCSNTNLYKTFRLILNTAIEHSLKQEELPKNLLIISDMEFDWIATDNDQKILFDKIGEEFAKAGYDLPKLIFWNVNSRTNIIPILENKNGVILVSGYSTAICDTVCSIENDPYQAILRAVNVERYDAIEQAYNNYISSSH